MLGTNRSAYLHLKGAHRSFYFHFGRRHGVVRTGMISSKCCLSNNSTLKVDRGLQPTPENRWTFVTTGRPAVGRLRLGFAVSAAEVG
jgi:hypothetical protein